MILELGCGIHRRGDTNVAIDKNPHSQADIIRDFAKRGIPFQDNYFDEVWCFDVIEHIEMYEDLIFTFNEIWRVLKPNGIWRFTTPNGVEAGFSHLTHHRVFFQGSFEYLRDVKDFPEWVNMRQSDGIVANFELGWVDRGFQILEGRFICKK
jgi:predicted SAM-dependent methyltransferase